MITAVTNTRMKTEKVSSAIEFNFNALQLARTVSTFAIPIIAMVILANIPTVSADRVSDCMDGCSRIEAPIAQLICYTLCLFVRP